MYPFIAHKFCILYILRVVRALLCRFFHVYFAYAETMHTVIIAVDYLKCETLLGQWMMTCHGIAVAIISHGRKLNGNANFNDCHSIFMKLHIHTRARARIDVIAVVSAAENALLSVCVAVVALMQPR